MLFFLEYEYYPDNCTQHGAVPQLVWLKHHVLPVPYQIQIYVHVSAASSCTKTRSCLYSVKFRKTKLLGKQKRAVPTYKRVRFVLL